MRCWLGLALVLLAGSASAANWFPINDGTNGSRAFVDLASVQSSGTSRLAWVKIVDEPQQSAASTLVHDEINCSSRLLASREVVTYGPDGQLVDHKDLGVHPQSIVPGSLAETEMRMVCQ